MAQTPALSNMCRRGWHMPQTLQKVAFSRQGEGKDLGLINLYTNLWHQLEDVKGRSHGCLVMVA